jgi:hypothetical protein
VTTQPEQQQATGYEVALAALVAAGVLAAGSTFDHLVPDGTLVEELPPEALDLLGRVLVLLVGRSSDRARGLADLSVAAVRTRVVAPDATHVVVAPRGTTASPGEPQRLAHAVQTLLARAADMDIERDRLAALDAELIRLDEEIETERLAAIAEAEAEIARIDAEEAAEDRAADREAIAERARERRALAEQRRAESLTRRTEARARRREAQRARVERLARAETLNTAAQALAASAAEAPEVLGWVRHLHDGACDTCRAWWLDDGRFGRVRPYSVPMKRHVGCGCVQRPVTRTEESDFRGTTDDPEPVGPRYRRARDRGTAQDTGDAAAG